MNFTLDTALALSFFVVIIGVDRYKAWRRRARISELESLPRRSPIEDEQLEALRFTSSMRANRNEAYKVVGIGLLIVMPIFFFFIYVLK